MASVQEVSSRAFYMSGVMRALKDLRSPAGPAEVYEWLMANGLARADDVAKLQKDGTRFQKEVRFARMMLHRAGLLMDSERGDWVLSQAGERIELNEASAKTLLNALESFRGGILNFEAGYEAIRLAALREEFIAYTDIAAAQGITWARANKPMPMFLTRLLVLAHTRGWPLITSIVVAQEGLLTGTLHGSSLEGFLKAARAAGIMPGGDPATFVREEQEKTFEWAASAPVAWPELRSVAGGIDTEPTAALSEGDALNNTVIRLCRTARQTAATSHGQTVLRTLKNKDIFLSAEELAVYVRKLFHEQSGRCAITGLQMELDGLHANEELLCSLDRIDSNGHYASGNLQVVCRFINRWKGSSGDTAFRDLIKLLK